jgi:hypothetical protein
MPRIVCIAGTALVVAIMLVPPGIQPAGGQALPSGPSFVPLQFGTLFAGDRSCYPGPARVVARNWQEWTLLQLAHTKFPACRPLMWSGYHFNFELVSVVAVFAGRGGRTPVITQVLHGLVEDAVVYSLKEAPESPDMQPYHIVRTEALQPTVRFYDQDARPMPSRP